MGGVCSQRCGSCKVKKPLDAFSPSHRGKTGTWCKDCAAANMRGERKVAQHESRICEKCEKSYTPKQLKESSAYCSRKCKDAAWREKHPEEVRQRQRAASLKRLYGISVDEYELILEAQGGVCALCQGPPKPDQVLHVDHDHKTGTVRGLLCNNCNRALGLIGEAPARLMNAAQYLLSHIHG